MTPCNVLHCRVSLRLDDAASKANFCTGSDVKTNLTSQRRLATQALAEEAIEFGAARGMSRVSIEERLGLQGNPLGQLLSEYLRGETAPSLLGIVRLEEKVARLVGRRARSIAVAEFDPAYEQFFHYSYHQERDCFVREYVSAGQVTKLRELAVGTDEVSSRAFFRKMFEPEGGLIQIVADGWPLAPMFDPPGGHVPRLRLPETCRNKGEMLSNLV